MLNTPEVCEAKHHFKGVRFTTLSPNLLKGVNGLPEKYWLILKNIRLRQRQCILRLILENFNFGSFQIKIQ